MNYIVLDKPQKEVWQRGDILLPADGTDSVGMIVERMDGSFVLMDVAQHSVLNNGEFSTDMEDVWEGPFDTIEKMQLKLKPMWKKYDSLLLIGTKEQIQKYIEDTMDWVLSDKIDGKKIFDTIKKKITKYPCQSDFVEEQGKTIGEIKREIDDEAKELGLHWALEMQDGNYVLIDHKNHTIVKLAPKMDMEKLIKEAKTNLKDDLTLKQKVNTVTLGVDAARLLNKNGFFKGRRS